MDQNEKTRPLDSKDPAGKTTAPEAAQIPEPGVPAKREPRIGLGVGLALGGWAMAAVPIMALSAYIELVSGRGADETRNIPMVGLAIACMLLGPAFLGLAAATGKGWAWVVTLLLALPVLGIASSLFGIMM